MPCIPRGETTGGIYHIINRGNIRMQVFDNMEDYEYFLDLLEKASKREKVEIHAYFYSFNLKSYFGYNAP